MGAGPLILALDTATSASRVALLEGETLRLEHAAEAGPHSARLLPAIEALLREAGVGLAEVDAFALAIGPGSFTGLRIGLATVKGLAFGTPRPVLGISSLQALAAAEAGAGEPVLALLDARRGELYAGRYERPGDAGESDADDRVATPEELLVAWPAGCRVVLGGDAGDGGDPAAERVAGAWQAPLRRGEASAERVGRLAAGRLAALTALTGAGGPPDPAGLVPRYLRRAEAEVRRTGRRFEGPAGAPGPSGRGAR